LGLLLERPAYAYELAGRLSERIGPAWSLSVNSVYNALDRLEGAELVRRVSEELPGRSRQPSRVLYHPTEKAAGEFEAWLATPAPREGFRHELFARIAVAREQDAPLLLDALDEYERECLRSLPAARPDDPGAPSTWDELLADVVSEVADKYLRAELEWIAAARDRIAEFAARAGHG
jgi:DNA-binding PadR family transcriptional regulator